MSEEQCQIEMTQAWPRLTGRRELDEPRQVYPQSQREQPFEANRPAPIPPRLEVSLPDAPIGHNVYLVAQRVGGLLGRRLVDLGFTEGTRMRVVGRGPAGNLIAVSIRSTVIALRTSEARFIIVSPSTW